MFWNTLICPESWKCTTVHQGVGFAKPASSVGGSVRRLYPTVYSWEGTLHRAARRTAEHRAAHQRPAGTPDSQQRDTGWGQINRNLLDYIYPRSAPLNYVWHCFVQFMDNIWAKSFWMADLDKLNVLLPHHHEKWDIFVLYGRNPRWKSLLKSNPQIFGPRTVCLPASANLFLDNVHTTNKQMEIKIKNTKLFQFFLVDLRSAHQNIHIFAQKYLNVF